MQDEELDTPGLTTVNSCWLELKTRHRWQTNRTAAKLGHNKGWIFIFLYWS